MRAFRNIFLIVVIVLSTSSCQHFIEKDYPEYLVNNTGTANLPRTDKASEYILTPNTQQHSYEFRAVSTGIANLWTIEFGKMLDDTLVSADVQEAFGALHKTSDMSGSSSNLLIFDLQSYTFKDYGAHISLNITLISSGREIFSKTYSQDGKTQGGKMVWGGAFAQKNAVQQSTKLALDKILRQLISDLNTMIIEKNEKIRADIKREENSDKLDIYTELTKLDDLRQRGIITEAEFKAEKAKILNRH